MKTLDQAIYDALQDYRAQAVALLGNDVCVGYEAIVGPDGKMQIAFTVSLIHYDGYKLQQLGSGLTFFAALNQATDQNKPIPTLRECRNEAGRRRQQKNLATKKAGESVKGELGRLGLEEP